MVTYKIEAGVDEMSDILVGEGLDIRYDARQIINDLNVAIPQGKITVIVGPNACGKSTLLRALSRLLPPKSGRIVLSGRDIHSYSSKKVAQKLGLLPQSSVAPYGIVVADLVARGRFPHQRMLQQWSVEDEHAVAQAMRATGITALAQRSVDELSGGQRQRVWLAMVLAQDTPLILLDEPTTFLDIAHQLDLLFLCQRLNKQEQKTFVLVLHDLNQAARFADYLVMMKAGKIVHSGQPKEVLTTQSVEEVFGLHSMIIPDPVNASPMIVPISTLSSLTQDEAADDEGRNG